MRVARARARVGAGVLRTEDEVHGNEDPPPADAGGGGERDGGGGDGGHVEVRRVQRREQPLRARVCVSYARARKLTGAGVSGAGRGIPITALTQARAPRAPRMRAHLVPAAAAGLVPHPREALSTANVASM